MNSTENNETLKAVLFDVDGTLADTERDGHRPAFNAAFEEFNLPWHWDVPLYGELLQVTGGKRSEERRVGKEGRSRRSPAPQDKEHVHSVGYSSGGRCG